MSRGLVKIPIRFELLSKKRHFRSNWKTFSSKDTADKYDLVVVGGGIVGVASARELKQRHNSWQMAVVEKESSLAVHQSGHNSGVIHAGIYYTPGSLKAKLCVEGLRLMYEYLDKNNIPYKKCGKLIVATNTEELQRLRDLLDRGTKNGVKDLTEVEGARIKEYEPHCVGLKALWSPHTGIVDYKLVTESYGKDFKKAGGHIHLNFKVNGFKNGDDPEYPVVVTSAQGAAVKAKYVLTCAGLYSDKVAEMSGCSNFPKIVPFRGEYLLLKPEKSKLVNGNIYPCPDPRFPFLGVHFTPRMDGSVWLGPNAVLAFRREGYTWFDLQLDELMDVVRNPGFRKLAGNYMSFGAMEVLKSAFLSVQVKDLQKFVPELSVRDVVRGPAGVRAQAMDIAGKLIDDFYFDGGTDAIGKRVIHCRNAPSPGATSSLAIARMIADKLDAEFK